jgi:hypothetical protein
MKNDDLEGSSQAAEAPLRSREMRLEQLKAVHMKSARVCRIAKEMLTSFEHDLQAKNFASRNSIAGTLLEGNEFLILLEHRLTDACKVLSGNRLEEAIQSSEHLLYSPLEASAGRNFINSLIFTERLAEAKYPPPADCEAYFIFLFERLDASLAQGLKKTLRAA